MYTRLDLSVSTEYAPRPSNAGMKPLWRLRKTRLKRALVATMHQQNDL
jgi:hypothetical protein